MLKYSQHKREYSIKENKEHEDASCHRRKPQGRKQHIKHHHWKVLGMWYKSRIL